MSDLNNSVHEKGVSVKCEEDPENCTEKAKTDGGEKIEKKAGISEELKSTLLFTATSIIAGYINFVLTPTKPNFIPPVSLLVALVTMTAIFAATSKAAQKLVGKKDMQWIMGNGGAIYLFLWFVSWIVFYNAM